MIPDERYIEIISKRMEEECGWSKASTVLNHFGWIDVVTHLWHEKGLAVQLLKAYEADIVEALAKEKLEEERERAEYLEER